jgi:hypothetical protein
MVRMLTFSEVGGHRANEDALVARPHPADPDCWLVCLADGQGGRAGGAAAAQLACRSAWETAAALPPERLLAPPSWPTILRRADEAVAADPGAGFTTLVGLCLRGPLVAGASSGDSAAFAVGAGGAAKELTAAQVKDPPVGTGAAVFVPFGVRLEAPWRVLVLSDGVWKYAGWGRVAEAAAREEGQALLAALLRAARLAGGGLQDDFTLAILEEEPEPGGRKGESRERVR